MESIVSKAKNSMAVPSIKESGIPGRNSINGVVCRCGALGFVNELNKGMKKMNMMKNVIRRVVTKFTLNDSRNKITVAVPPVINPVAMTSSHATVQG